jgi:replicative DNA helicase
MTTQTALAGAPQSERAPPYSLEAERAVLGAALVKPGHVIDLCVESQILPDSFFQHAHQVLYQTMLTLQEEGKPVDFLSVGERLNTQGRFDLVGGPEYLDHLVDSTPSAYNVEYYIQLVHEKHLLRCMIERSRKAIEDCYQSEEDATALLNQVEQSFFELGNLRRDALRPWSDMVKIAMKEIEHIFQTKQGSTGLPTGYRDLDRLLMGMQKSDILILAARPSMGKTSLALNIVEHIATRPRDGAEPGAVAVFSLEMSSDQLVRRMICAHAKVPSHKLSGGYINTVSHASLTHSASALMRAPIFLDDSAGLSVLELRSRARRLKKKHNIQLVVVDYLQLLNYPQFAKESRQREVSAISGALKSMAKELQVPVLVLSQLSRAPETRDRRAIPRLSDLRESGSIEQDADVVLLLRRPCKYPDDPKKDDRGLAIVDIAKHRNGPTGEVELHFEEEFMRFEDRARGIDTEGEFGPSSGSVEG